jgi:hypothetical protein
MRKPDSLREWLLRSVPGLDAQPERLHLFVEEGRVHCVPGKTLSYQYVYQLVLILEDFGADSHALIVPILAWLAQHQPDLLHERGDEGLPISQDILDNKTADFEMRLDLKERVIVTPTVAGGWAVEYAADPQIIDTFEGADGARLWRLYLTNSPDHVLAAVHPDHVP